MKLLLPLVLIAAGLGGLIAMGVARGGIPEMHVRDVLAGMHPEREVKVHAIVSAIHSEVRPLRFTVSDKLDAELAMEVFCDRLRPDTFQEGRDVAVQGVFDAGRGLFVAHRIYTKCPSKYEAAEELLQAAGGGYGAEAVESEGEPAPSEPPLR